MRARVRVRARVGEHALVTRAGIQCEVEGLAVGGEGLDDTLRERALVDILEARLDVPFARADHDGEVM